MGEPVWVVGDPQGHLSTLERVLTEVGLLNSGSRWTERGAALVVAGDLVDNGPAGLGVIELLVRLQSESRSAVQVVIGNHDVQLLAARRFGGEMVDEWLGKGGAPSDLKGLTRAHVDWLSGLPAMILVEDTVVVHADALFYREYGSSVEEVNDSFRRVLGGDDLEEWQQLLEGFGEHRAFSGPDGEPHLQEFLETFGGSRLVHGHTPIARMLDLAPETVTEAYVYCNGRCVNVDPGIYLGGPGFAYRLR